MLDRTKPVQTKGGNAVCISCWDDGSMNHYILGSYEFSKGRFLPFVWPADGKGENQPYLNLVNVPERWKRTWFINVYREDNRITIYFDKIEANECAAPDRIACIEITREGEVGEGL